MIGEAQRNPDKPAVIFEGCTTSFSEFNARSNQWANALSDLGVRKGERVGILLPNRPEFLETFFGVAKIGAVLVPLNLRFAAPALEYICKDSGIRALVFGEESNRAVETIRSRLEVSNYLCVGSPTPPWSKNTDCVGRYSDSEPELVGQGDAPLVILYTSGTTGNPKGAVKDHESYLWMSMGLKVAYGGPDSRPDETALVVVPLYHGWGLNFSITAVDRGIKIVLMRKFNPLGVLKIIKEEKIDTFLAVPPMLQRMAWVPGFESYLVGLRTIETYETFPPGLRGKYVRQGATIRRTYGLVETGYVTMGSGLEASGKSESDGCPLFCTKVRIIDEEGIELSPGEVGEIIVRSPTLMKEYWARPEATEETFKDGWLHTGDLGRLDEDGYLYMIGRKKDIIVSGGEIIAPAEVEKVLRQNPKILEVAIVGRADSVWGEKVCAVVRPVEGARIGVEELAAFCQGKLATFQIPKEVIITNEPLPYDMTSGKLVRRALRERLSLTQTSASSY